MSDSTKIQTVKVLSKTEWTPNLFSFTTTRPDGFKFAAGQFVRLGLNVNGFTHYAKTKQMDSEDIFRAYSIVSSPYHEYLEFFSVVIPNGMFTSKLQYLQVDDELLLNTTPFGFLTLARYQKPMPKDLWLLATGTGIAPFLSMLQDMQTWQDYEQIILSYSVRYQADLAYHEKIREITDTFSELVESPAKLIYQPIVTRERVSGALSHRLTHLLQSGELESAVGLQLDTKTSHVMLCGNPKMVEDTKEMLKIKGLVMNRRGEGNIAVENYW